MPSFLEVYQTADDQAHDAAAEDPFPAYLEGVDTTLAPFCPTSATRVMKALRMGKVGTNDRLVDLGSGDGRFVTAAVSECGCRLALGIESDQDLVTLSRQLADQVFSEDHTKHGVRFEQGDLLSTLKSANSQQNDDIPWTVVVLFLLPDHSDLFADDILQLHQRGARIISLVFNLDEINGLTLQQADEQDGIFIYGRSPLV